MAKKKIFNKGGKEDSKKRNFKKSLENYLKNYLKVALKEGRNFEAIKQDLLKHNWPEDVINKVLKKIHKTPTKRIKKIQIKNPQPKKIKNQKIKSKLKPEKEIKLIQKKIKILTREKKPIQKETEKSPTEKTIVKKIIGIEKFSKKKEYVTDLDLVLKAIEKYNQLKISEIAANFKVDKKKVEEWGKILEEHNLIKVRYPAIGEPEFVKIGYEIIKKQKKKKIPKKKKMLITLVVVLIVIIGVATLFITPPKKSTFTKVIKKPVLAQPNIVLEAFSGKSSYICNSTDDIPLQYFIKNKDMRIESKINGKTSLIIVRGGYAYTYLDLEDKWIKKTIPETLVIPSSGKIPKISLLCEKTEIKTDKFSIPENKILEI